MTKKSLFLTSVSVFFLMSKGVFAWGAYDAAPTYYTYGTDLPSIYDGYTLKNDNRMDGNGLYSYGSYGSSCDSTVNRTLSLGSTGEDVATVQDYLFDQDFLQSQPNAYFGYGTKTAVKLFQSRYGIKPTGTVGFQTRTLLNNLICGGDTGVTNTSNYARSGNSLSASISQVTEIPRTTANSAPTYNTNYQYSTQPTPVAPVTTNVNYSNNNSYVSPNNNYSYNQSGVAPIIVNRAPTVTIVVPINKSFYKEGDTIPATWVTSNMQANRYSLVLTNTSTGLEKQVAALPGSLKQYNVVLTKELLDAVCAGTTACTGINSNTYRLYVKAYYQTQDGELAINAYADQMTITRPQAAAQVVLTPSKNPVTAGDTIKLYAYTPNTALFNQYSNLYWKIRANCPPAVTIQINGQSCGTDVYVYQANTSVSPEISVQISGNLWGPAEITFDASALSYYGGQVLGSTQTKILVNK